MKRFVELEIQSAETKYELKSKNRKLESFDDYKSLFLPNRH